MKKILFPILISTILLPLSVFALTYERIPSGSTITNPISFNFEFENNEEILTICGELDIEFLDICTDNGVEIICSELMATSTLNYNWETNLPVGEYTVVEVGCYEAVEKRSSFYLEVDGIIFEVVEEEIPPLPPIITINTDFVSSTLAYVGQIFTDTTLLIVFAIGLPVGFWVVKKIISLVKPK